MKRHFLAHSDFCFPSLINIKKPTEKVERMLSDDSANYLELTKKVNFAKKTNEEVICN